MADNLVPPSGTPPAATVPPVAAQPVASSSTVQENFSSTVQAVKSPAAVRAAIQEMTRVLPKPGSQPQPAPAAPAPIAVEATPAAEPEVTPPASEETPAADEPAPEVAADAGADDPETEEDGEGPITPVAGKRAHLRLAETDQVGRLAASYMKRNRDMPMEEAVTRARSQLGIKPETASPTQEVPDKASTLPQTTQATDALMEQRFADYEQAMTEVRLDDAAKINREIHTLTLHRSSLERRAERDQVTAERQYHTDFDASHAKAAELYPFVNDPASAGAKRILQIEADLKRNADPLYNSASKPLKLAQMVAAELNIAPRNKNATPAKPAAAPAVATPAPKKGVLPTGGSRTVPPATNQPAVDPAISGIRTHADLRTQLRRLGIK